MSENNNVITLCPSNWLYNAGVVGLLRIYEKMGYDVTKTFGKNGLVEIETELNEDDIFNCWDSFTSDLLKISYKGKKGGTQGYYYSNQTERSITRKIKEFIGFNQPTKSKRRFTCSICGREEILSSKSKPSFFNQAYSNILLASEQTFPNSYWNAVSTNYVCSKCDFVLLCHHIGLTEIKSDRGQTYIFINSPNFKEMFYLNKLVSGIAESNNSILKGKREILAMSIIEYTTKLKSTLGLWSTMNVEIITKSRVFKKDSKQFEEKIENYSMPDEVIRLLTDRKVSEILGYLNEYIILNNILNQEYQKLVDIGYNLLKESLKDKPNNEFIDSLLFMDKNKGKYLGNTVDYIFKLYSHIEEKLIKEKNYA